MQNVFVDILNTFLMKVSSNTLRSKLKNILGSYNLPSNSSSLIDASSRYDLEGILRSQKKLFWAANIQNPAYFNIL